ncbi:MAG: RnfH family protein [Xanthomonadales bacterium]|nr:RnfH family protein [Xanthomonadales bacterium]MBK7208889.1 RnfH family protein [Xanthomonadales bacterium]MBL0221918.1 RnfH family protein [Xanthomonadales bacterium]
MTFAARRVVSASETIRVEVAYAEPARQFLRALDLPRGSTADDAIAASNVAGECAIDPSALLVGIWSKIVAGDTPVQEGDRVELLRPLEIDPKEARRKRAKLKTAQP